MSSMAAVGVLTTNDSASESPIILVMASFSLATVLCALLSCLAL